MLHQLDPPNVSTKSEFVLQEPNGALSKTNEPHGAQACHSCKQVFLFLIAGNMLHLLDPPKTDQHRVNSYSRNQIGLSQRQMSPMRIKPAIAISKYFSSQMLETCCTSWTLQKGRQGVNSYSRNQMGLCQRQMSPMGHKPAIAVSKFFCF